MGHHITSADILIDGDYISPSVVARPKLVCLSIAAVGSVISVLTFLGTFGEWFRGTYSYSWLFAFFYFFTLSIGGVFWTLLHNVTNSGWGTSVRRTFENLGATYPWVVLAILPLLYPPVQQYLYEWMKYHRSAPPGESVKEFLHHENHLLYSKYWYLNIPFWYGRALFYILGISVVIWYLRRISVAQDTDPNPGVDRLSKARKHSTYTLIIFALTITFIGFDFLMGLDYSWFSTMWGVYLFSGSALNSMAIAIVLVTYLKSQGHLRNVATQEHFHIMGKLLFAFTVFWAYIAFSQYFLIWYANITEETRYFLQRNTGNWNIAQIVLVFGHFVIPFVVLLQAWIKKNPKYLSAIAVYTLIMHALDHYLIIIPERGVSLGMIKPEVFGPIGTAVPGAFWGDILAFLTLGSAFGYFLLRAIGQHSLYPNRDPRILESANLAN